MAMFAYTRRSAGFDQLLIGSSVLLLLLLLSAEHISVHAANGGFVPPWQRKSGGSASGSTSNPSGSRGPGGGTSNPPGSRGPGGGTSNPPGSRGPGGGTSNPPGSRGPGGVSPPWHKNSVGFGSGGTSKPPGSARPGGVIPPWRRNNTQGSNSGSGQQTKPAGPGSVTPSGQKNTTQRGGFGSGSSIAPKPGPARGTKPPSSGARLSGNITYEQTDGIEVSCDQDCAKYREPQAWCRLKSDESWTEAGCHCNRELDKCIIKKRKAGKLFYTYCVLAATLVCP